MIRLLGMLCALAVGALVALLLAVLLPEGRRRG